MDKEYLHRYNDFRKDKGSQMKESAYFKSLFICVVLIFLIIPPANAKVSSVKLSVEVPAGQWKAARINNLPKDAVIKADIGSDRDITALLLDQGSFEKYPNIQQPLYQSKVHEKLSFTVTIPAGGHYYLVFDNGLGLQQAKLNVFIQGAVGPEAAVVLKNLRYKEQEEQLEKKLGQVVTDLNKSFIFIPFPIKVRFCGQGGTAFSGAKGILLCLEFVQAVQKVMGDQEKSTNVLLFTIFHEIGHTLLSQWGYPFYDNEEVADEFATVLIIMMGQKERLSAVPEYFISRPSLGELLGKALKSDRHPLSVERARNIVRWMKDPQLIKRWQTIFVPHMQTAVLEKLQKTSPSWADLPLIEKELVSRQSRGGPK
jgi:hypothetical protein